MSYPYVNRRGLTSEKLKRFLDLCQMFHLPVVDEVDHPEMVIGLTSEEKGMIRKGE
ncbi:hypothetical protein [Alkalihalobacterium elongatum]|uniref:hypothetical protein n=1 Tax=Alkalihalobacterium elongatum TaxID=2675466 RepID=UPI001C1FE6D5|nr:hypothetical protein [Alkalihalobacterium elongatum]